MRLAKCTQSPSILGKFPGLGRRVSGAFAVSGACTAIAYPLYSGFGPVNTVMLYLLATTVSALRWKRGPCVALAVSNMLAFDYFFVPPIFSFDVEDTRYIFTLFVMLVVALVITHLMVSIRRHRSVTESRERRTAVLYAMSRELVVSPDAISMSAAAARHIGEVFHGEVAILIADQNGALTPAACGDDAPRPASSLLKIYDVRLAQEVAARGERQQADAIYLPLPGAHAANGVAIVRPRDGAVALPAEQLNLLDAFAAQLAMALQRARVAESAEAARLAVDRACLRNNLLSSISHDLRTPLAAIAGAGNLIAQGDMSLNTNRRAMLGQLIERKATDMWQLVSNVLDLTRMEFGEGAVRADWHAIDDLVSHSLRVNAARLAGWRIDVDVPTDLPLVRVDATLILQMFNNLLENAAKYTPRGTRISIRAEVRHGCLFLEVVDDGPGLPGDPERLFEKFQRGNREGEVVGVGLGLAICRTAARLHGGDIRAKRPPGGGAGFEITLRVQMRSDAASGP